MSIEQIPTKRQAIEQATAGNDEPLQRLIRHDREQMFKSMLNTDLSSFFYNCMLFHSYNFAVKNGFIGPMDENIREIKKFAYHINEPEKSIYQKHVEITDLVQKGRVKKAVEVLKGYYTQTQPQPYFTVSYQ